MKLIKELKKELLDQKHHITDLEIESDHNLETIKNQNGLIKFYKQYRLEHEDDAQQQKIALFEEKPEIKDEIEWTELELQQTIYDF